MGASSSSSNPVSSFSFLPQEIHDVFISFRGEDTRYTFTAHLLAALRRLKIRTFIDNELRRGDEISPTLLRAIEESKVSVIIFSRNYATSKWCLDELLKIMDCRRRNEQIVIPIFYYIDPSDVRNQTGSYADAFATHEQRFRGNMQKVQKWRDALTEAANLSGWDCLVNRVESELVEEIAKDVLQKLSGVRLPDIDGQITTIEQLAQLKAEKLCRTGDNRDLQDLAATYQHLAELNRQKLEDVYTLFLNAQFRDQN